MQRKRHSITSKQGRQQSHPMRDQAIFLYAFSPLEKGQASEAVYVSSEDTLRRGPLVSELSKSGM